MLALQTVLVPFRSSSCGIWRSLFDLRPSCRDSRQLRQPLAIPAAKGGPRHPLPTLPRTPKTVRGQEALHAGGPRLHAPRLVFGSGRRCHYVIPYGSTTCTPGAGGGSGLVGLNGVKFRAGGHSEKLLPYGSVLP